VWIEIGDSLCRVKNATPDEQDWVQRYLSFEDVRFKGRRRGHRVSLFSTIRGTFPAGLLQLVRDAAGRDGVKIEELDRRSTRITPDPNADVAWLRDYQIEAVEACIAAKRGICRAPTGSGKGDMIVGLVKRLPGRWLFLVHRDNLVSQQAKRYKKYTGLIANEMSRTPPRDWKLVRGLNLMTLQSLAAGLRADREGVKIALSQLDGLVIDECHTSPADVYYNAIQQCHAEYRLGFSGTPLDRGDNRSLMAIACLGKVVYSIKPQVLIDAGFLAAPQITMVPVRQTASAEARAEGFHGVYEELICASEERNAAIVEIVRGAPKPCMVFVRIVEHGRLLVRAMRAEGINTEFVWGEKSKLAREGAVERLERGDSEVLVASVVFQEGVDIPGLESVVVASGGKSIIAALQRVGRGMRTDGGRKVTFDVYDVLDLGSPMMERHSRRRMNTYVRESYATVIRSADGTAEAYQPRLRTRREKRERIK